MITSCKETVQVTNSDKSEDQLPEGWRRVSLQDITTRIVDGVHHTPQYQKTGVPFLTVRNLTAGPGIDFANCSYVSGEDHLEFARRALPQPGDVLVSKDGTLGVARVVPADFPVASIFVSVALLRPDQELALPETIHAFFDSGEYEQQLGALSAGTGLQHIHLSHFRKFVLTLPPLPEQRAIAEALGDVDALIAAQEKLIAKKRAIKTATMQRLLTGKQRLPGFGEGCGYKQTEIGVIPEDWSAALLQNVCDVDVESLSASTPPDFLFNYISLESVNHGQLESWTNEVFGQAPSRARRILRRGDVIFSTVRPLLRSHLFFNSPGCFICSTGFAQLRVKSIFNSRFLYYLLFSRIVESQVEKLLAGSNYPAVNSGDVKKLLVPCPTETEQAAISGILRDLDEELSALEKRLSKTKAIKQGMMQELLTGRTRLV